MASVAEVKAAIDAAIAQVSESQAAIRGAREKLGEAQQSLAAALDGSAHESVISAQAALLQAGDELEGCLAVTAAVIEQAQTYSATL